MPQTSSPNLCLPAMAGLVPEGSQVDAKRRQDEGGSEELFTPYVEVCESFDAMGLHENLLRGIYAYGFKKPSATQQRGIIPFCRGLDVVQQAHSGTGRTATFCSGILQQLDYGLVECQALVLVPSRELGVQTERVLRALGDYLDVKVHACIGGTSVREDQRIVENGVHVILGTPGRMLDMLELSKLRRQFLRPELIKIIVLDDTDELLSSGFKDQIYNIFKLLPSEIQVGVFSATMPSEVLEFTRKFMKNPVRIHVKRGELTLDGIKQFYVNVEMEDLKLETLFDLYDIMAINMSVIFVNTRRKVDWLIENMRKNDYTVSAIHGDMDQSARDIIMRRFRNQAGGILITAGQLACVLDVGQDFLAINYDLPAQPEYYLHRIGRSGESTKDVVINFVTRDDERILHDIQSFYNVTIEELPPNVADFL